MSTPRTDRTPRPSTRPSAGPGAPTRAALVRRRLVALLLLVALVVGLVLLGQVAVRAVGPLLSGDASAEEGKSPPPRRGRRPAPRLHGGVARARRDHQRRRVRARSRRAARRDRPAVRRAAVPRRRVGRGPSGARLLGRRARVVVGPLRVDRAPAPHEHGRRGPVAARAVGPPPVGRGLRARPARGRPRHVHGGGEHRRGRRRDERARDLHPARTARPHAGPGRDHCTGRRHRTR